MKFGKRNKEPGEAKLASRQEKIKAAKPSKVTKPRKKPRVGIRISRNVALTACLSFVTAMVLMSRYMQPGAEYLVWLSVTAIALPLMFAGACIWNYLRSIMERQVMTAGLEWVFTAAFSVMLSIVCAQSQVAYNEPFMVGSAIMAFVICVGIVRLWPTAAKLHVEAPPVAHRVSERPRPEPVVVELDDEDEIEADMFESAASHVPMYATAFTSEDDESHAVADISSLQGLDAAIFGTERLNGQQFETAAR